MTAAALLASDPDEVRQVAGYYREAAASIADRSDELDVATRTPARRMVGSCATVGARGAGRRARSAGRTPPWR